MEHPSNDLKFKLRHYRAFTERSVISRTAEYRPKNFDLSLMARGPAAFEVAFCPYPPSRPAESERGASRSAPKARAGLAGELEHSRRFQRGHG
jgi:hypothetical protein